MNFLDAMSAIGQGFDTCALNMSRNRFQRSSLITSLKRRFESCHPHHFKFISLGGCSVVVTRSLAETDLRSSLCVRKLMIKAYKLKTLKSYGLRFIYFSLNYPAYGAWHPFFMRLLKKGKYD